MFPIQDLNPRKRMPIITYALIIINVLVFLWEMSLGAGLNRAIADLAVVPANVTSSPVGLETIMDIFRSMFLHGGIEHIFGNMLYLWLFGDNLEDRLGGVLYLLLYFISGVVAVYAQVLINPQSTIPMVGASGAIAGVLGGYLVMFPGVRVRGIVPLGYVSRIAEWPAWTVLGLWFVLQVVQGFGSIDQDVNYGGVAVFAHIGGFIAGLVLTWLFMRLVPQPPPAERRQLLYERAERGV